MATLSLKKPHPKTMIGETPLVNLHGKYAVMRQLRKTVSMRFTCVHDTLEKAQAEASRLSLEANGKRYLVVHIVSSVDWMV